MKYLFLSLMSLTGVISTQAYAYQMYIFGDSLSDTGNVHLCAEKESPDGRFSNGKLWTEWLSSKLNIPVPLASINGKEGTPNSTNFACSGATATPSITNNIPGVSDIKEQIIGKLNPETNVLNTSNSFAREQRNFTENDIVFVWAGANNLLYTDMSGTKVAAEGMSEVLRLLGERDVRKLVILNLPDIGLTPRFQAAGKEVEQAYASEFSSSFNNELDKQIEAFKQNFTQARVEKIDMDAIFHTLIAEKDAAGFTQSAADYWTKDSKRNPDEFIFFDDIHPMEKTYNYISERFLEQLVLSPTEKTWNGTLNALWTSAESLRSFSETTQSQIRYRNLNSTQKSTFWVSGLGSYIDQSGSLSTPGYNYRGWGYSLGADYIIAPNWLAGLSYGQAYGTLSIDESLGNIDKTDNLLALYGKTSLYHQENHTLTLNMLAGWGTSRQKSNTRAYGILPESHTSAWNDNTWVLETNAHWNYKINDRTTWICFTGLQYLNAQQEASNHGGSFASYHLSDTSLYALRLPIGTGLQYTIPLEGASSLTLESNVALYQDLARKNPKATVSVREMSWQAQGCAPSRSTLFAQAGALYQINAQWGISLHYSLNSNNDVQAHSGQLSASYSF